MKCILKFLNDIVFIRVRKGQYNIEVTVVIESEFSGNCWGIDQRFGGQNLKIK